MTKDTEEFSQFTEPVTCRENTEPRDDKSTHPKGWGTVICMVNTELRSELSL